MLADRLARTEYSLMAGGWGPAGRGQGRAKLNLCLLLLAILAAFFVLTAAGAQEAVEAAPDAVSERRAELDRIAAAVSADDVDLTELGSDIRAMRRAADADALLLRAKTEQLRQDLEQLGEPPAEGETEPRAIAAERNRLESDLRIYDAAERQLALNIAEADRLLVSIATLRTDRFVDDLVDRGPSPLNPQVVTNGVGTFAEGIQQVRLAIRAYVTRKRTENDLGELLWSLGLGLMMAIAFWVPIRHRLNSALRNHIADIEPLASRRVLVAATSALFRLVPALIGGYILYEALRFNSALPPDGGAFVRSVWLAFITLMLTDGAVNGIFSPRAPAWRVLPLDGAQVQTIRVLLLSAALVVGIDGVLAEGAEMTVGSDALTILREATVAILLALILLPLASRRLCQNEAPPPEGTASIAGPTNDSAPVAAAPAEDAEAAPPSKVPQRLRFAARLVAVLAIIGAVAGYVSLAHYAMTRLFGLFAIGAIVWILRALLREMVRLFDRRFSSVRAREAEDGERFVYFWITTTIDVVALLAFVPPALLLLGWEWSDVSGLISDAFFGFQIGAVRISIAKILTAVLLFVGLMYLTKGVQKTAETRFFSRTRIDTGLRNSFKTLIGYVGLVIAFATAIGTLGFNLSNLAIIAGALSVGIGFGLQSIVNNFVSGLILLFERPIKVGDWIVTSAGEGIVQRISVRSTEIETFDRSSVIVPNADLISSAVTNWTHKNKIGRIVIPVGISYDLDPAIAIRLLEEVAREDRDILNYPPAYVYFDGFGESSQDLQLRGYIRDVGNSLKVRTNLRVAIWKKFKSAGVEIPFPQRDVHVKTPGASLAGTEPVRQEAAE